MSRCGRCGQGIGGERWEYGWPNYGRIEIGFAAQIGYAMGGSTPFSGCVRFAVNDEAQSAVFQWSNGYRPGGLVEHESEHHLCFDCQRELLKLLGAFFGARSRVAAQAKSGASTPDPSQTASPLPTKEQLEEQ